MRSYEWQENSPVQIKGAMWDTAFAEHHVDGRELDVHAVWIECGVPRLATADPWLLPADAIDGSGQIGDFEVPCANVSGQQALHVGYKLTARHRADLA